MSISLREQAVFTANALRNVVNEMDRLASKPHRRYIVALSRHAVDLFQSATPVEPHHVENFESMLIGQCGEECGGVVNSTDKFCANCGRPIKWGRFRSTK